MGDFLAVNCSCAAFVRSRIRGPGPCNFQHSSWLVVEWVGVLLDSVWTYVGGKADDGIPLAKRQRRFLRSEDDSQSNTHCSLQIVTASIHYYIIDDDDSHKRNRSFEETKL